MCETIDPGSCIWWVLSFCIKVGYDSVECKIFCWLILQNKLWTIDRILNMAAKQTPYANCAEPTQKLPCTWWHYACSQCRCGRALRPRSAYNPHLPRQVTIGDLRLGGQGGRRWPTKLLPRRLSTRCETYGRNGVDGCSITRPCWPRSCNRKSRTMLVNGALPEGPSSMMSSSIRNRLRSCNW
jgi:hypothetical protein